MKIRIKVMSKLQLLEYRGETSYVVISIFGSTKDPTLNLEKDKNRFDILRVKFDDTSHKIDSMPDLILFSEKEAEQILMFLSDKIMLVEEIVCQCEAGISRSSAVAGALGKLLMDDDTFIFNNKRYRPNMLVYSTLLKYGMENRDWRIDEIKDE